MYYWTNKRGLILTSTMRPYFGRGKLRCTPIHPPHPRPLIINVRDWREISEAEAHLLMLASA